MVGKSAGTIMTMAFTTLTLFDEVMAQQSIYQDLSKSQCFACASDQVRIVKQGDTYHFTCANCGKTLTHFLCCRYQDQILLLYTKNPDYGLTLRINPAHRMTYDISMLLPNHMPGTVRRATYPIRVFAFDWPSLLYKIAALLVPERIDTARASDTIVRSVRKARFLQARYYQIVRQALRYRIYSLCHELLDPEADPRIQQACNILWHYHILHKQRNHITAAELTLVYNILKYPYAIHDMGLCRLAAHALYHWSDMSLGENWMQYYTKTPPTHAPRITLLHWPTNVPAVFAQTIMNETATLLAKPVTNRYVLLGLYSIMRPYSYVTFSEQVRVSIARYYTLMLHSDKEQIIKAIRILDRYRHHTTDLRSTQQILDALALLYDTPLEYYGQATALSELARRCVTWHREQTEERLHAQLQQSGLDQTTALPPVPHPVNTKEMTFEFLATTHRIVTEGVAMSHCVAGYATKAVSGHCYLYHVTYKTECATAEIGANGLVCQIRGPHNSVNTATKAGLIALKAWGATFPKTTEPPRNAAQVGEYIMPY